MVAGTSIGSFLKEVSRQRAVSVTPALRVSMFGKW